ncbi:hypothetical protein SAMN04487886_10187 [Clostridium sp. DSM 8431]|uniref:hypothetical protein n=1 Tax=Clostridium sp. DSM 8431 TaxID=1761781 RepID=UPI0008E000C4|nr:hypothetical protein [Clostridium sp. DSM 8431]SFU39298.1 hypothetical protein SAMN04487886_10187 [Clostridium sp. DSM 8431]
MKELFKIKDLSFYEEDFLDDIKDYEDIIPIIKEMERKLTYEKLAVTEDNECCGKSRDNYFIQIHGYINKEDEFITNEEVEQFKVDREGLDLFVIRIYKCVDCGKWIIDILE